MWFREAVRLGKAIIQGFQKMDIEILHSDRDVLVCAKPSGMLSQSDEKGEKGVKELIEESSGKTLHLINRLDRPVSGLMVFALNPKAAAKLSADVAEHTKFVKEYLVCISGKPMEDAAILKDYLFRDRASGKTFVVNSPRKGAKDASLEYKLLETVETETGANISLLAVRLHTGRTHQIRAQLSSRGMPVAGDGKYGSRIKSSGIALHSYRVIFSHPFTAQKMEFTCPPIGEIFEKFSNSRRFTASINNQ